MTIAHFKIQPMAALAVVMLAILVCSIGARTAGAIDERFFSTNEIMFTDPNGRQCEGPNSPGSGGPANIDVDKGFSLGTDAKERRVNLVRALMKDFQLSMAQAAGIVGNFMHESGGEDVPPNVNEGGQKGPPQFKGGYGWAQWTGGRQTDFINFAVNGGYMASRGVDANDAANYAWLKKELTTGYKSTITALKSITPDDTDGAAEAAVSFEATFERAGVPALTERKAGARKVFGEVLVGTATPVSGDTLAPNGNCPATSSGSSTIVGEKAFPLRTTKSAMDKKNPGMFKNGDASKGGHPYTAYDIMANPKTEVVAFLSGKVTHIGEDKCPGRLVSIYNKEANLTISYLHMNMDDRTHVAKDTEVAVGEHVGFVGSNAEGCGSAHLHIDAARGTVRPGCRREDCPAANAAKFVSIGPDLSKTYDALPQ